jgi:hypothetical protein
MQHHLPDAPHSFVSVCGCTPTASPLTHILLMGVCMPIATHVRLTSSRVRNRTPRCISSLCSHRVATCFHRCGLTLWHGRCSSLVLLRAWRSRTHFLVCVAHVRTRTRVSCHAQTHFTPTAIFSSVRAAAMVLESASHLCARTAVSCHSSTDALNVIAECPTTPH